MVMDTKRFGRPVPGQPKETDMQVPTGSGLRAPLGTQTQASRGRGTGGYGVGRDPLSAESAAEDITQARAPQAEVPDAYVSPGVADTPGTMSDELRAQISQGASSGLAATRQAAEAEHQRGLQNLQAGLLSQGRQLNPQMAQAMQQRAVSDLTSEKTGVLAEVQSKEAQWALGTMAEAESQAAELGQQTNHLIATFAQEAGIADHEMQGRIAQFNAELAAEMQVEKQKAIAVLLQQGVDREIAEMEVAGQMARLEAQLKHDHWAALLADKRAQITASMELDEFGWDIDPETGERTRSAAGSTWDSIKGTASDTWGDFSSWWEEEGKDAMIAASGQGDRIGVGETGETKLDQFRKTYGMGQADITELMTSQRPESLLRRFPVSGQESIEGKTWDLSPPPTARTSLGRINEAESKAIGKAQEARDYMGNINKGVGWAQKGIEAARGERQARQVGAGILQDAGKDFAASKLEPMLGKAAGPAVSIASDVMTDQPGDTRSGLRKGLDTGKEIGKNVGAGALASYATGPLAPFTQPLIKKGFDWLEDSGLAPDPLSGIGDDLEYGKGGSYLSGIEALHARLKGRR